MAILKEIHPGEILLEDFIKPMQISGRGLAAALSVPVSRVHEEVCPYMTPLIQIFILFVVYLIQLFYEI